MKTLELENCGLQEMNAVEMKSVDGGNIFVDAWNWLVDSIQNAWENTKPGNNM